MKKLLRNLTTLCVMSCMSGMALATAPDLSDDSGQTAFNDSFFAAADQTVATQYAAGDKQGLLAQVNKLNQLLASGNTGTAPTAKADTRYLLALSNYRLGLIDYKNAKTHLQQCIDNTNNIIADNAQYTEAYILTAACANSLIGSIPERTMELSLAGRTALQQAAEQDPANPRLLYIQAVTAIYTPPQFGGGLPKASTLLEQSIQQFQATSKHKLPDAPRWGLDEAYLWTGVIYSVNGKNTEAITALEKSLQVSQSSWVQKTLLPTLQRGSSIGPHFGLQLSN